MFLAISKSHIFWKTAHPPTLISSDSFWAKLFPMALVSPKAFSPASDRRAAGAAHVCKRW